MAELEDEQLMAMGEEEREKAHRFVVLDSLRGVSALLIAVIHFDGAWHFYGGHLFSNMHFFVDFFFVLSGFVISYSYADCIASPGDAWRFVVKRFGRVWPLHAFILAIFIGLEFAKAFATAFIGTMQVHTAFTRSTAPNTIVTNILLMNSWGAETTGTWNIPSWSIGAEFYTYLVFAAACLVPGKSLLALAAGTAIFGAVIITLFAPGYMVTGYDYGFYRCLYGFFTGVLLYFAFARNWLKHILAGTMAEICVVGAVILFLSITGPNPSSLLGPLIFGAVVYVYANEGGVISQLLRKPSFTDLGLWSYSIYMTHILVFMLLIYGPFRVLEKLTRIHFSKDIFYAGAPINVIFVGSQYVMDAILFVYLAIVVGVASLTYRWIEAPCRAYFRKVSMKGLVYRKTEIIQRQ